jgi:transposase
VESKVRKVKRVFTEEFKTEAIILAEKVGNSQAAKDLGLSESLVRLWRKKKNLLQSPSSSKSSSQNPNVKSYDELEKEVRRLTKENGYLQEINKVLKKSTAIFSASLLDGIK